MPQILLEGRRVINNITRASALFLVKNIFSMLLSLALMILPFAYPFQPIQLTLVSTLTIGFPSFVLALQPSREKSSGNFLMNIFLRALPGGLCVAILLLCGLVAGHGMGLDDGQISTLCTLAAAFSCYVVLALTCRPLNGLRIALLAVVALGLCLAVAFFPGLFSLVPLTGWALGLTILLCALALPLQLLIAWLMKITGKKKKSAVSAEA
jgi:cation-transporting ATPase E